MGNSSPDGAPRERGPGTVPQAGLLKDALFYGSNAWTGSAPGAPRKVARSATKIHLSGAVEGVGKSHISPSSERVPFAATGLVEPVLLEMEAHRKERTRSTRRGRQGSAGVQGSPAVVGMGLGLANGDTQEEMLEKARELFQLCDKEEKGLITKRDLQRLQSELPLTPEQLEAVFESLDQSNNGYLTPVEFSMGLGKLFGVELFPEIEKVESSGIEETFESGWSDELDDAESEERRFCSMMEQLGAAQIFEGQREVRELWARLRKDRPELLANFEEFLYRVSSYIREVHHEKDTMEQALKRKETDHGREVRTLYEEMEQQIKIEKERLLGKDSSKHNGRNTLLQKELRNKEQELENIVSRQKQLERRLQELNSEQVETRVRNEQLRQLNQDLLEQLEQSRCSLEAARGQLQTLQKQADLEQDLKDRVVFKVSKNMQKEKQSLLRQLELLREMNKKLRDDRDSFEAKKLVSLRKTPAMPVHLSNCCCCHKHVETLHCHEGH
ncbi:EF-hand calcium-binding domain-containing protein 4A isoform X1 [Lissotriton helveticus]